MGRLQDRYHCTPLWRSNDTAFLFELSAIQFGPTQITAQIREFLSIKYSKAKPLKNVKDGANKNSKSLKGRPTRRQVVR
jgi:hypothetical protein